MVSWYWAKAWALFIPPVSWTWVNTMERTQTGTDFNVLSWISHRTRFIQASFCPTRAWKQEWRWRWSGCQATQRRNIVPSGPPHPTASTQCGTRSLLFLRRFISVQKFKKKKKKRWMCRCKSSSISALCCNCCLSWRLPLLLWWIGPAARNGLSQNCGSRRER